MSNALTYIYRIATAIVAAQGVIVADISAFNPPARIVSAVFGGVALIALLTEFVVQAKVTATVKANATVNPPAPPAPPAVA